ncbi:CHAT domain-containing protein [Dactylosporangium sp. NPDC051541]|uniref:CHAT domain-containing protein n=1 Tax=Dactylosporangium sp. NPDC051541 TaxID=3363977 RepID=UPI00378A81BC
MEHDPVAELTAEAVSVAREAVRLGGDAHPNRLTHLFNLGKALMYQGQTGSDPAALAAAREVLAQAASLPGGAAGGRIAASRGWAEAAMRLGDFDGAEFAYRHGVDLLVELAGSALAWTDREHGIDEVGALPCDAAAAAIAAGHPRAAMALLEQSRGLLLAEALHTHIDVEAIARHAPELAADFVRVSAELRSIDLTEPRAGADIPAPTWVAQRRLALGEQWRQIRERIRAIPGFEEFLRPPSPAAVGQATAGGTAVIVNISAWRCDALLVSGGDVESLPLPALTSADCLAWANRYLAAIQGRRDAVAMMTDALADFRTSGDAEAGPRYQAANLPDIAVSSYAPTLRALVTAHRARAIARPEPRLLVVAMPNTPGQAPLPNAARERDHLLALFPPATVTVLSDAAATTGAVVDALADHRLVHFSCHGELVVRAPSESRLLFADGSLTVAGVIAAQPQGEFAFLSACKTAAAGVTLLNETITLAAALHYAGYRHVIATLWSVYDSVAADVAAWTYEQLTAGGQFDSACAARALHGAVQRVRAAYADQPSVWTPFIHIGV